MIKENNSDNSLWIKGSNLKVGVTPIFRLLKKPSLLALTPWEDIPKLAKKCTKMHSIWHQTFNKKLLQRNLGTELNLFYFFQDNYLKMEYFSKDFFFYPLSTIPAQSLINSLCNCSCEAPLKSIYV